MLFSHIFWELKLRFTKAKPERLVGRLLFKVEREKGTQDGLTGYTKSESIPQEGKPLKRRAMGP